MNAAPSPPRAPTVETLCSPATTQIGPIIAPPFHCRRCGAFDVDVVAGDELLVDAVELDDAWRRRPVCPDRAPLAVDVSAEHLKEHAMAESDADEAPRQS